MITISSEDADRLARLLEARHGDIVEQLEDELVRAHIIPLADMPADVARLGSRVRYESDGTTRDVVLVWPHEASLAESRISVLSPIGAALLGLRPGQRIAWPLPGDRTAELTALSVEQPL